MTARLVILGTVSFLVFLVGSAPATLLTGTLGDRVTGLGFEGVSGTLWTGSARTVTWFGRPVGAADWSVAAGALLAGDAAARLEIRGPGIGVAARLERALGSGRTVLSELQGSIAFDAVQRLAGAHGPVNGRADISGVALTLENDRPVALSGRVILREVSVSVREPRRIGDFVLDLGLDGERLFAAVTDDSPVVAATGGVHYGLDGRWAVDLRIRARTDDGPLNSALAALGPADAGGFHRLELSGGP